LVDEVRPRSGSALETAQGPTTAALLAARDLDKSFDGLKAVDRANIEVASGSITGLIGPNGAGKTTLFNLISGFASPDRGRVSFDGTDIQHLRPHQIAQHGLVRTFQTARVLARLSVLDNMLLGAQKQAGENPFRVWFHRRQVAREQRQNREWAMTVLEAVGLGDMAHEYAGSLSGGQRKLLEMARTLMVHPKLVLLDEPVAGVNPKLVERICEQIAAWNRDGIAFLIVEHNMDALMSLCDRIWVLAQGRNLAQGTPTEIQTDPQVLDAYLGR